MDIEYYINKTREQLTEKRFNHSLRVMQEAVSLAEHLGVDVKKAELAGILHDYAKNMSQEDMHGYIMKYNIIVDEMILKNNELSHGIVAAHIVKDKLYINDNDILNSIRYHTTGRAGMSMLEKVIFMADYIEPMRNFDGIDIVREMTYKEIDRAVLMALDNTIKHLVDKGVLIHQLSLEARNYYLQKVNMN